MASKAKRKSPSVSGVISARLKNLQTVEKTFAAAGSTGKQRGGSIKC